jgi:limonene-1,2-epoxide hydrolase
MTSPKDVVEQYVDAFAGKDVKKMRSFLSDTNFSFKGPMQVFATADDFAAALVPLVPIIQSVDVKKVIADGNDVCMFYDLATTVPSIGTTRIAELFRVENGKIISINLYFDPRPYVAIFGLKQ